MRRLMGEGKQEEIVPALHWRAHRNLAGRVKLSTDKYHHNPRLKALLRDRCRSSVGVYDEICIFKRQY
jgi:hypothetical protein